MKKARRKLSMENVYLRISKDYNRGRSWLAQSKGRLIFDNMIGLKEKRYC